MLPAFAARSLVRRRRQSARSRVEASRIRTVAGQRLTPDQYAVAQLQARGLPMESIRQSLRVSPNEETRLWHIFQRYLPVLQRALNSKNVIHLGVQIERAGLADPRLGEGDLLEVLRHELLERYRLPSAVAAGALQHVRMPEDESFLKGWDSLPLPDRDLLRQYARGERSYTTRTAILGVPRLVAGRYLERLGLLEPGRRVAEPNVPSSRVPDEFDVQAGRKLALSPRPGNPVVAIELGDEHRLLLETYVPGVEVPVDLLRALGAEQSFQGGAMAVRAHHLELAEVPVPRPWPPVENAALQLLARGYAREELNLLVPY
ncbi:MAG TPA: hypothetical protein VEY30_06305, partial [Myxococcaceae bacterium]|nr:hypothetical protein [Myxococcaceae bacterium]